jgi:hypothetical protein
MQRWWIALGLLSLGACNAGPLPPEPTPGSVTTALTVASAAEPAPATPSTAPTLSEERMYRGPDDAPFLVTPRWSPAGDRLLVSGHFGIGLHLLDLAGGSLRTLDPSAQGRAVWSPDALRVLLPVPQAEDAFEAIDVVSGTRERMPRPAFLPETIPLFEGRAGAEFLFDADGRRLLYEEYSGRLVAWDGDRRVNLVEVDAWGPRAAPDGRRVAWCEGHLHQSELVVAALDGTVLFRGRGAHPAWLADGARLVFSEPAPELAHDGRPFVGFAELWLLDVRSGARTRLTDTPELIEMEPALSPQGTQLAWADWSDGTIHVARFAAAAAAEEGGRP